MLVLVLSVLVRVQACRKREREKARLLLVGRLVAKNDRVGGGSGREKEGKRPS